MTPQILVGLLFGLALTVGAVWVLYVGGKYALKETRRIKEERHG
jgi:hypothetical protein